MPALAVTTGRLSAMKAKDESVRDCLLHVEWVHAWVRIKQALGGKVRLMATGAAPLSKEVHEFLQVWHACPPCRM